MKKRGTFSFFYSSFHLKKTDCLFNLHKYAKQSIIKIEQFLTLLKSKKTQEYCSLEKIANETSKQATKAINGFYSSLYIYKAPSRTSI